MPTYRPDDWQQKPPPNWRDDPDWYIAVFVLSVVIGIVVALIIDGGGL